MILMIIIVLYHSLLFMNGQWFTAVSIVPQEVPSYICKWLNSFPIYSFVFISGYIFYYQKYEKGKYTKYLPFIINKSKRLLVPFVFVCLVWAIPLYIAFYGWNFNIFVHNYMLMENPAQLWFLLMLFLVFAMFWPLSNLFKKKCGIIIAIMFLALSIIGSHYLANYFHI